MRSAARSVSPIMRSSSTSSKRIVEVRSVGEGARKHSLHA
jgi:hypothetical protein